MGFRVGQHCPECGTVINAPLRSVQAQRLILATKISVWFGIPLCILAAFLIPTGFWILILPLGFLSLSAGLIFAILARYQLLRDQSYDERARDELRIGFISWFILVAIIALFIGADLFLAFMYALK